MLLTTLLLLVGLALLIGGGDFLVRGASGLARALGISPLIVGLTVVAFGTSAPELAVNLVGAWEGEVQLSFGNIFGSNLANIGLVLGIAALVRPLRIRGVIIVREIPMAILATVAAIVMVLDPGLRGAPAVVDRADGLLLLLFFGVFLYYTVSDVLRDRTRDPLVREAEELSTPAAARGTLVQLGLCAAGLAGLVAGGHVTVDAATAIARELRVPEVVIGLTMVGVGTSLPELAASFVAAWRGQHELVLGNILGSNIFNTLLILGLTAIVHPLEVPAGGTGDVFATLGLSFVLFWFALTHRRHLVRWEGAVLALVFLAYTSWRVLAR